MKNPKKILLVEDDFLAATIGKQQLEKKGYIIIHASNGEEAVKTAVDADNGIDLILMDIDLGSGIDGTVAAEEILKKADIPVVFLSSHTEPAIVEKTEKITSYGYVVKNSGIVVLDASIKMAFRLHDAKQKEKEKEIELRESEEKFRTIFENAPLGIFRSTPEGKFIEVNTSLARMLGYERPDDVLEEIHSITEQIYLYPSNRLPIVNTQMMNPGITHHINHYRRRDGENFTANLYLNAIRDIDGTVKYLEGIVEDITELKKYEEKLGESEQKFRSLADYGQALIWTAGLDKKCDYFNQPWLTFTGRTLEQETGDGWTEGVHPDDFQRCVDTYIKAFEKREKFSMDYRLRHSSGEYRWIQDDGTPRFNSKGEFTGYIGHCLDITEKKLAQETIRRQLAEKELLLEEARHRIKNNESGASLLRSKPHRESLNTEEALEHQNYIFDTLLNNLQTGVMMIEAPSGNPLVINEEAYRLLGRGIDPDATRDNLAEVYKAYKAETGEPYPEAEMPLVRGLRGETSRIDNMEIERPDGTKTILEVFGSPVMDSSGEIIASIVSFTDITERLKTEEARQAAMTDLESANEELNSAMEEMETANEELVAITMELQESRTLLSETEKAGKIGGWTFDVETLAQTWTDETFNILEIDKSGGEPEVPEGVTFINPPYRQMAEEAIQQAIELGDPYAQDWEVTTVKGNIKWVHAVGRAHQKDGQTVRLSGSFQDITERKLAEEKIKALLDEKDLILKEVHHRIKNNMNVIFSLLQLQAESLKDTAAINALQDSASRVRSMMVLYDRLYRMEYVKKISVTEYVPALVDEIISNFPINKPVLIEKKIDEFTLNADRLQPLGIIINELLTNILKYAFTEKDSGKITVSATVKNGSAVFVIHDDGIGIPESISFEKSTGFGLQLVRLLTMELRGTIRIERGIGTSVILEFGL
jgi:PAS domain S-box-containing protein